MPKIIGHIAICPEKCAGHIAICPSEVPIIFQSSGTIGTGSHEFKNVTSLLDSLVARNKYSVVSAQTWSRVHCVMCSRAHRYRICEFAKQEVDLLREILLNSLLVEKTGQVCLITTCSRGNQCHFTFMVEEAWPTIFY